jgi:hypothetical protein
VRVIEFANLVPVLLLEFLPPLQVETPFAL